MLAFLHKKSQNFINFQVKSESRITNRFVKNNNNYINDEKS